MTSSGKQGSYISHLSFAILDSSGWYQMQYKYAEKSFFGSNAGCEFLERSNCNFPEFCNFNDYRCNWEEFGTGSCELDNYAGDCKITGYYSNTICHAYNYLDNNLNKHLHASES